MELGGELVCPSCGAVEARAFTSSHLERGFSYPAYRGPGSEAGSRRFARLLSEAEIALRRLGLNTQLKFEVARLLERFGARGYSADVRAEAAAAFVARSRGIPVRLSVLSHEGRRFYRVLCRELGDRRLSPEAAAEYVAYRVGADPGEAVRLARLVAGAKPMNPWVAAALANAVLVGDVKLACRAAGVSARAVEQAYRSVSSLLEYGGEPGEGRQAASSLPGYEGQDLPPRLDNLPNRLHRDG